MIRQAEHPNNFIKYDAEKPILSLIEPRFILGLGRVLTVGARKYAPKNWQKCETPVTTYYSALLRHLAAWHGGEAVDAESGESHLYHAICNLHFLSWFEEEKALADHPSGAVVRSVEGDPPR